jgi:hypothetical protein
LEITTIDVTEIEEVVTRSTGLIVDAKAAVVIVPGAIAVIPELFGTVTFTVGGVVSLAISR